MPPDLAQGSGIRDQASELTSQREMPAQAPGVTCGNSSSVACFSEYFCCAKSQSHQLRRQAEVTRQAAAAFNPPSPYPRWFLPPSPRTRQWCVCLRG